MKIFFLIYSLESGGAERVTVELANHFSTQGHNVSIATITDSKNDFYKLVPNIKRLTLNKSHESKSMWSGIKNNISRVSALHKLIKNEKPDVAIAMMTTSNILLAITSPFLKNVITIGSERVHPPKRPLGKIWELLRKFSYSKLDAIVAQTEESAKWIRSNSRAKRVATIPNPSIYPLPQQTPYLEIEKKENGKFRLLAVGRLVHQKGFDLLIEAFSNLSGDFPEWQLDILGDGTQRQSLQNQIISKNLENKISLRGKAGNIGDWYEASDLYVMSSRFEGFPNALIEAITYGVPVISFDCETGPKDMISHEKNGLLVPDGDIKKLEEALKKLMSSKELRQTYSKNSENIKTMFSIQKISKTWEDLFANLTKRQENDPKSREN